MQGNSTPVFSIENDQFVAANTEGAIFILRPKAAMSPDEALRLAAWLVAIVGDYGRFDTILSALLREK